MSLKFSFIFIMLAVAAFGLFVPRVFAQDYGLSQTAAITGYTDSSGKGDDVNSIVLKVVNIMLALLGFLFFGLISYAGFRWMTARGNEELSTKAKDIIEAAVIGIIVVVSAYALTSYIFSKLGVAGGGGGGQTAEPEVVGGGGGVGGGTGCHAFDNNTSQCADPCVVKRFTDSLSKTWTLCTDKNVAVKCTSDHNSCTQANQGAQICDLKFYDCMKK